MTMRAERRKRLGARLGAALAAAVLAAGGAGCTTPATRRPPGFPADHTVSIVFVAGCPRKAIPGNPCGDQCMKVRYDEQLLFQAVKEDGKTPTDDKLAVQFDPFQGPPGQGVGFVLLTVRMNAKQGTTKKFPYNVQSGACAPLDPDVQVEW
jgi:hypothetical protein